MNSRLQAVQGRLKVAHSVALSLVMLLVKGSVEVRYNSYYDEGLDAFVVCSTLRNTQCVIPW